MSMLNLLLQVLISAVSVFLAAKVVPGVRVRSFGSALIFAIVLGLLDKLLFKLLVILGLPLVVVSFGLFIFVINAFLFWLADKLVDGVEVDGFGSALLGSIVTSLFGVAAHWLLG
ncbi:MAG TPA: phage holin family protein [Polyangia bacterium]|jgi:putative membrane protein|nr:phage holin family protein [Polyangia bacterium]